EIAELRRHVALVMLGKDRVGNEDSTLKPPFGNRAAAFAKKVGRDPAIDDRGRSLAVAHDKADRNTVAIAANGSSLDHSPQADRLSLGSLAGGDVGWRVEIGGAVP